MRRVRAGPCDGAPACATRRARAAGWAVKRRRREGDELPPVAASRHECTTRAQPPTPPCRRLSSGRQRTRASSRGCAPRRRSAGWGMMWRRRCSGCASASALKLCRTRLSTVRHRAEGQQGHASGGRDLPGRAMRPAGSAGGTRTCSLQWRDPLLCPPSLPAYLPHPLLAAGLSSESIPDSPAAACEAAALAGLDAALGLLRGELGLSAHAAAGVLRRAPHLLQHCPDAETLQGLQVRLRRLMAQFWAGGWVLCELHAHWLRFRRCPSSTSSMRLTQAAPTHHRGRTSWAMSARSWRRWCSATPAC